MTLCYTLSTWKKQYYTSLYMYQSGSMKHHRHTILHHNLPCLLWTLLCCYHHWSTGRLISLYFKIRDFCICFHRHSSFQFCSVSSEVRPYSWTSVVRVRICWDWLNRWAIACSPPPLCAAVLLNNTICCALVRLVHCLKGTHLLHFHFHQISSQFPPCHPLKISSVICH